MHSTISADRPNGETASFLASILNCIWGDILDGILWGMMQRMGELDCELLSGSALSGQQGPPNTVNRPVEWEQALAIPSASAVASRADATKKHSLRGEGNQRVMVFK